MTILKGKVNYVGVNDRTKDLFESLWPLPYGVSYNSYLIDDDKVTLIDTVDVSFFPKFLKNIHEVIGDRPIDYLVINHMEPDHSGSISLIRKYYPNITIVGNKKTLEMVNGFYGEHTQTLAVSDGAELNIGHHKLRFYLTPMVHWPETMMTFDENDHILFSGDAFGCFGALNGAVVDKDMNIEHYWGEMIRYYSNIVGKYGSPVQKALAKLGGIDIEMICSTHGPVWTEYIPQVVAEYNRMSLYEGARGVVIAYGSMYGHAEEMAEAIAAELAAQGVKNIVMHNVARTDHSYILADIFRYKGLVLGCPTYNTQLFPEMDKLLKEIASREVKNRVTAYFGTFSWAGQVGKKMCEWNEKMKFTEVCTPVECKQGITPEVLENCSQLAKAVAAQL